MRRVMLALSLLVAAPALAEEPGETGPGSAAPAGEKAEAKGESSPEAKEAQKVLTSYLETVKKKKWKDARKFVHPETLKLIDAAKKKNPKAQNRMDPESWAKEDFWLKDYAIADNEPKALGTVQFTVKETNFRVQEKGVDSEPESDTYLLGKQGGKWLVVDKRTNNTFDDKSIKASYKGYFDGAKKDAEKKPVEGEGGATE